MAPKHQRGWHFTICIFILFYVNVFPACMSVSVCIQSPQKSVVDTEIPLNLELQMVGILYMALGTGLRSSATASSVLHC